MKVKYRIGFTVDAETLFGLIAKFLPFEDLHVEEIVPHAPKPPNLAAPQARQRTMRASRRDPGYPFNLTDGVNGVIMGVLADGEPHRYIELKAAVTGAGYAGSGIGSRMDRLHAHKAVERVSTGLWRKV